MSNDNAVTPDGEDKEQTTPAENPSDTPAGDKKEETISLPKSEWERMKARQSELDKRENLLKKKEVRLSRQERKTKISQKPSFTFEEPEEEAEPSQEEMALAMEKESLRVEKGVLGILKNKDYQELFETDSTLRELVENNPLGLPIFKDAPIDAEDALERINDYLSEKATRLPSKKEEKKEEEVPPVPNAGPTNPPAVKPEDRKQPPKPSEPQIKTVAETAKSLVDKLMGGQ